MKIGREEYTRFSIQAGQRYRPGSFTVPADFSSASFMIAAVSIAGGRVVLTDLNPDLPQGDSAIVEIVRGMGVKVQKGTDRITVESDGGRLAGGTFDLGDTPDLLPVVAALALKSDSPVEVVGTAHARFKETDRIAILAKELSKLGAKIEERPDGMKIHPVARLSPAPLDAHDDHRMFMAFSLASMLIPGGTPVVGVESLDVSYPDFPRGYQGARGDGAERMTGNIIGERFVLTSFGESHGKCIGAVIDGCPAGLKLTEEDIQRDLDLRKPGQSIVTTQRKEGDVVEIMSGTFRGYSTGAPIMMIIHNQDQDSRAYEAIVNTPRPGHADATAKAKYGGFNDYRGGGRFSGRITATFVMGGAIAKKLLKETLGVEIIAYTGSSGG